MSELTPAWFCVRSQPKHEHIAAAHLKQEPGIEVYLPRIQAEVLALRCDSQVLSSRWQSSINGGVQKQFRDYESCETYLS
jgi:hypothetical protein